MMAWSGHFCLCPQRGIVDTSDQMVSVRVHALTLGEAVRDDGIAGEFVIQRPLRMPPFAPQTIGIQILVDDVYGDGLNHSFAFSVEDMRDV